MRSIRLSVLDQSPVPDGYTAADALSNSLDLAKHVDQLGYTRLWYSEHHSTRLLASTAPEILIARAAAATHRIRLGSGGVMLPHYAPLKVAEVFRTLHAMFPGRIDLGLGRAPGGQPLESYALRRDRPKSGEPTRQGREDFPEQLSEITGFLEPERFPIDHPFKEIRVSPYSIGTPDVWLLGSSMWSAATAAREALPYAYAHFFSAHGTRQAINYYQRNFASAKSAMPNASEPTSTAAQRCLGREHPEATIAIGVICAATQEEAEFLYSSMKLLQRRMDDQRPLSRPMDALRELDRLSEPGTSVDSHGLANIDEPGAEWPRHIVGAPKFVADKLITIACELEIDELIVNTITHDHEARKRSYSLLAEAMGLS